MTDKCRRINAGLELCDNAKQASSLGFVEVQTLRNMETKERRQRLAIRKGKKNAPFDFCPWCGSSVNTKYLPSTEETA